MSVARVPSSTDVTDFRQDSKTHTTSPPLRQGMESASNYLLKSRSKENPIPSTRVAPVTSMATNSQYERTTEYDVDLLKHLADDFAELLTRRELSDCFLCVQGRGSMSFDRSCLCSSGTYMAVHRCVLAARSQAFAG